MQTATKGGVEFAVRFQTLGTLNQARKIQDALLQSGAVEAGQERYATNLAFLLAHTTAITVTGDHPELQALGLLWTWWTGNCQPPFDAKALWEQRLALLGVKAAEVWNRALLDEQATILDAPRELLPDHKLTGDEQTDPS